VIVVSRRVKDIKAAVAAGELACPVCGLALRPWGHAAGRTVRTWGTAGVVAAAASALWAFLGHSRRVGRRAAGAPTRRNQRCRCCVSPQRGGLRASQDRHSPRAACLHGSGWLHRLRAGCIKSQPERRFDMTADPPGRRERRQATRSRRWVA
jgi:hypothetical protein